MTAPTKLHIETLREMFAVCANERRMKEADAINAAIAALAPPSGEGMDNPLVQRLGMLVTMLRAEAAAGNRGYNFGEDAANRRSGRIADEIEQAIHEVRVLGKSHPQTAGEAELCRTTTPQPLPAYVDPTNKALRMLRCGLYDDAGKALEAALATPQSAPADGLTFDAFRASNVSRCVKWHPEGIASWSPSDWLTAVTGELGELASLLKMRNRERDGLPGNKFSPTDKMVADELADVLTYLDLLAAVLGVDLGRAAVEKFNEVSERVGFPDRINALTTPPPASQESGGAALIAAERERQITVEGWTPEHDDEHDCDELANAAACYATPFADRSLDYFKDSAPASWPWESKWWKPVPNDRVRELVKAGALIAAEIDRLQRASPPSSAAEEARVSLGLPADLNDPAWVDAAEQAKPVAELVKDGPPYSEKEFSRIIDAHAEQAQAGELPKRKASSDLAREQRERYLNSPEGLQWRQTVALEKLAEKTTEQAEVLYGDDVKERGPWIRFSDHLAELAALRSRLAGGVTVDDAMVERARDGQEAYWDDDALYVTCERCNGKGHHGGFGEGGHDQDWCETCGGPGSINIGTEAGAMRAALVAALGAK